MKLERIHKERQREFRETVVRLGELETPAYVLVHEDWNGFAIPYLTRQAAGTVMEKWLAANLAGGVESTGTYDEANDRFILRWRLEGDAEFGEESAEGHDWYDREQAQFVRLYCIGGWSWCWEDVNRPARRAATADELVGIIARLRLSTEGEDATLAEEITGEDDALVTLDDLIVSARQVQAADNPMRDLLGRIARDLRDIEDTTARDADDPRTFWLCGNIGLDLIEQAEKWSKP